MSAKIICLGHAGLDLRLGAHRVVCDPWLTTRGAYLGSWHQFPDNAHVAAAALHDAPAVFISSPRPDHFDADTLAAFPKTTRIFLPASPSPVLAERIRALGFTDVVELVDGQPVELGPNARLQVVTSARKHVLGATLVLEVDGQVIIAQGDGELDADSRARLAALAPAVHFLSFSGASYGPAVFDLPLEERQKRVDEEVAAAFARFLVDAREVGARHVVPSGGPPCFVDDGRFESNFGGDIFYDADELVAKVTRDAPALAERLRLLYPGDVAVEDNGAWTFDGRRPYEDKRRTLEAYRERRLPLRERHRAELRAEAEPVDAKEVRSYLRDLFQFEDMTWNINILLQVELADGPSVWVDFRKKPYRYVSECDEAADHVLSLDAAWMSLVLQDKTTWHDLLMAHDLMVRSTGGRESPKLMSHLDYRHDPALFDLVRRIDPALITVEDEQMAYVCQRFCPHRGRDLEYAIIERGVLTCTAHGWRFDLRKGGRCLWGGDAPLLVKEMRPRKT
jgi:Rieske [2Fe-2S] domain